MRPEKPVIRKDCVRTQAGLSVVPVGHAVSQEHSLCACATCPRENVMHM